MLDENDPIKIIVDGALGVWAIYEFVKRPAIPTTAAYAETLSLTTSTIAAAALVSGALAAGGPALSAEQPVRKPAEHVGAQTQENTVGHELETLVVGSTSGNRIWSHDDSTPLWSGNDFEPFWRSRADRVRAERIG